jgi:hypothetical protein
MNKVLSQLSPSITDMIRMDHNQVLSAFHQYDASASARARKALADSVCLWLEIHAQLEEEIFYPALREIAPTDFLDKSVPEHDRMRQLMGRLRTMQPTEAEYNPTFFELMNVVMHHVADEETLLLPTAERVLADRLGELGARMTQRRLQLTARRSGEIASTVARSVGTTSLVLGATALLASGYLLARPSGWRSRARAGRTPFR